MDLARLLVRVFLVDSRNLLAHFDSAADTHVSHLTRGKAGKAELFAKRFYGVPKSSCREAGLSTALPPAASKRREASSAVDNPCSGGGYCLSVSRFY